MNQRLQHIVEHYDEMCIGTDEHFRFHCKQCGKCCINREDILLNPKDLYNISKELGLAPRDTIAHYCEVYLGQNSRIPIVRLKPRGSIKRCPLLRDRKCSVHNAKPTVCALFPLGRSIKLDAKKRIQTPLSVPGSSISSTPLSAEIVPKSIPYASG